jgi:hypothetical protein
VRPEELSQLKIPVTPSGIEPSTFRILALFPDQLGILSNNQLLKEETLP